MGARERDMMSFIFRRLLRRDLIIMKTHVLLNASKISCASSETPTPMRLALS